MKKIVSVILAISLIFSMFALSAYATVKTECGGNCDTCPSIVVPGIGQSNIWALDDNGDYLLDADGEIDPRYYRPDMCHLCRKGYMVWYAAIKDILAKYL